ncbi:MAG: hypothetical protein GEU87_01440 [Alphaproteobacteria bacterium]|nr:hypothetical protein [Alphaproteobacteria bacterium]
MAGVVAFIAVVGMVLLINQAYVLWYVTRHETEGAPDVPMFTHLRWIKWAVFTVVMLTIGATGAEFIF